MIGLFSRETERIAKIFKSIIKDKHIKIFAQFDTDGITSAAIMSKVLIRQNKNFELRFYKQLNKEVIEKLNWREGDFLIFLDFGSGQLKELKNVIEKTNVLIIDHHEPLRLEHPNLFHLNPLLFGEKEYSTSIISYIFAKLVDIKNIDLIDLAILGAIGDEQDEKWEFKDEIRKIVNEGISIGKISVIKDLRIYGRTTRPIHKALAYTFDPYIPGVSGSEAQAVKFLNEIGIPVKVGDRWKKLIDLTEEEKQKLATAIIFKRLRETKSEDIFGEIYLLVDRPYELQDSREFSTIINACGRMGDPATGLRLCLGDYSVLNKTHEILEKYRKEISEALNFIREENPIVETEKAIFVLGKKRIKETIIGTVISILQTSNFINSNKPIFGLAEGQNYIKVSARSSINNINLKDILVNTVKTIGGEAGGHKEAAGAYIDKDKEQEFIKAVNEYLGRKW